MDKKTFLLMILLPVLLLSFKLASGQQQTFDLITFTPPNGWKREAKNEFVNFSIVDQKSGNWAQIEIYKSIGSSGDSRADFEYEWRELVVKRFGNISLPATEAVSEEGWTAHQGAGVFTWQGKQSYAVLNTISGYGRVVTIVVLTNTNQYNAQIDRVIQSIELQRPSAAIPASDSAQPAAQPRITGTWYKVSATSGNTAYGYRKCQYTFNDDGTYVFYAKTFDVYTPQIVLRKENGTYTINGNTLSLTPSTSVVQTWSKKDNADKFGVMIKAQRATPEHTVYTLRFERFGDKLNLLLSPVDGKTTAREGAFGNNSSSSFPNTYFYEIPPDDSYLIELPEGERPVATQTVPTSNTLNDAKTGQQLTFDLITFTPPSGWKREAKDELINFSTVDQKSGTWAQIEIYKSIGSSGDSRFDFEYEWNELIVKRFGNIPLPSTEAVSEEGWTAHQGAGVFNWQGKQSYAVLNTISGYGRVVTIVVLTNTYQYNTQIDRVIQSIDLRKPEGAPAVNTQPAAQPSVQPLLVSDKPGNTGISISTTNFDDGWVAKPFADYVKVTKGTITVLLHYAIEIDDNLRNTGNIEGVLFDRIMLPRYTVSNLRKYDNNGPCYFCIYFYEADVVDKATGKKYYAGFRVLIESGVARCIEIIAPSAQEFRKEFPNQEKIEGMLGYNKFAVTLADLVGTWEKSSGTGVNMYNTVTGAYAGMATASSSHSFVFNADGTYNSRHSGAHGMVGDMTFFNEKYEGKLTVTNWDITMTNRWQGKTEQWWAHFEAVRGGRVLHINDKAAPAVHYALVKTK